MLSREQKLSQRFNRSMICGKKIVNSLTGESQKKAGKQAVKELAKGREAVEERAVQSRADLFDLFGSGQESRRAGLEGALDVFRQSSTARPEVFQGGNVAAQEQLLAGLPQIGNAITGRPIDLSALQPTRLPFNFDLSQVQLPATAATAATAEPEQPELTQEQIALMLAGRR